MTISGFDSSCIHPSIHPSAHRGARRTDVDVSTRGARDDDGDVDVDIDVDVDAEDEWWWWWWFRGRVVDAPNAMRVDDWDDDDVER